MARMPVVPDTWLANEQDTAMRELPLARDQEAEITPFPMPRDAGPISVSDMVYRHPQPARGTLLSMLMDPHEIASIPGRPDHVYQGLGLYGDQRGRQDADVAGSPRLMTADAPPPRAAEGRTAGYDPALDKVSLTPPDWDSSGLDLSKPESAGPKNPIGPVQGYPEDGKHAWRAANDDAIVEAVGRYNTANKLFPGDSAYMTPKLMKAWMMRESGGTPDAFRTDPFQVNKTVDWPKTGRDKERVLGLSKGQRMTPQTSADGALKWLQQRGTIHDARGNPVTYVGHHRALELYNADPSKKNGMPAYKDYASDIVNRAWASYGDWQQ